MKPQLTDSQFDERFGILKNKLACITSNELTRKASEFATARLLLLSESPVPGHSTLPTFEAIHRAIFQNIFPWAGDFREVVTSRTGSSGFPPPQFIIPSLKTLFNALKTEKHLKALDADTSVTRAGYYLGEINAIHAFREGKGRAQREFIRTLALQAGHPLTWKDLTPDEINEASRMSFATGDNTLLAILIRKRLLIPDRQSLHFGITINSIPLAAPAW